MPNPSPSGVIKPEVRGLSAYTLKHFDAGVKLDQNENPYELPTDFTREVAERLRARTWARYPEFVPAAVIQTLAKFTGWHGEGILVGNGTNELIQASLTVTLGPGRKLAVPQPTFTLYKLMAKALQAEVAEIFLDAECLTYDVDKLLEASRASEVVVVCAPNNPTGNLLEREALVALLKNAKGLVLVDEAYHEFSRQTAFSLLADHRNLVILRTFSKAMAMAGLRFGYMMAHPEIAREAYKSKLPYNVNIFTLTAAELVIENRGMLARGIDALVGERDRVFAKLQERPYVRAFPSATNFILMRTAKPA